MAHCPDSDRAEHRVGELSANDEMTRPTQLLLVAAPAHVERLVWVLPVHTERDWDAAEGDWDADFERGVGRSHQSAEPGAAVVWGQAEEAHAVVAVACASAPQFSIGST